MSSLEVCSSFHCGQGLSLQGAEAARNPGLSALPFTEWLGQETILTLCYSPVIYRSICFTGGLPAPTLPDSHPPHPALPPLHLRCGNGLCCPSSGHIFPSVTIRAHRIHPSFPSCFSELTLKSRQMTKAHCFCERTCQLQWFLPLWS